ncbi:MAG: hypothetical protein M1839_008695 [Geoglossum umbratile]|nr:MAG: hypothetical protein M1839_008695 [Geoglossum umbratile]
MPRKLNINSRTIAAPIAALTMAGLLFVYSRTSIQAAKRNAQRHRDADGGQISWHNESLRRHGRLDRPRGAQGDGDGEGEGAGPRRSGEEVRVREEVARVGRRA